MKRYFAVILLFGLLLTAGCSSTTENTDHISTEQPSVQPTEAPETTEPEMTDPGMTAEALREQLVQQRKRFAVAYLGFLSYEEESIWSFLENNADIISELAFINEIPDTNVSCNTPCGEVYCILPVDPEATVAFYTGNSVDNEYWEFNELIYEGTGEEAYLLVCNNACYPDTEVQITFPDDTTYCWNPMLDDYYFTMGLWGGEMSDSEDGYETLDITPYDKILLAQYDTLLNGFDSTWAIPTKEDLIGTSWYDDGYDVSGEYYLYRMTVQEESIDVQWILYGDSINTYPDAQYTLETKNGVAVLTVDFKEFAGVKSYNLLLDIQAGLLYTAVDATDGNIATTWERQYRYLFAEEAAEPVDMVGTWELAWTEVEGYREELDYSATTIVISGESEEELTITYTDSESPSESFQDKALTVVDEEMYYECGNDRWLANVDYVDDYGTTFAVTLLDDGTLLMQMYWEIDDGVPMVAYRGFSKA